MAADDEACYGPGSIALAVILTVAVTLFSLYVFYIVWKRLVLKKEKHLTLESDPEKGKNSYAFDNDGFTDPVPPFDQTFQNSSRVDSLKSMWSQWSPVSALFTKNEKQKTLDDSILHVDQIQTVLLKSQDFTGLGFNIYGNMRDGIFIKDILHRGPALESGKLNPGDRIKSVTINFDHIVYEDALTILSYASPYEVIIKSQRGRTGVLQTPSKEALGHPLYKSSSSSDLIGLQKKSQKALIYPSDSHSKITTSTATTLEAPSLTSTPLSSSNHDSTKSQLEQRIQQDHKYQLHLKQEETPPEEFKTPKYPKFGIKVLPVHDLQQISPKINESSQNDNNINLEIQSPSVEMDRKTCEEEVDGVFSRSNGSGIKRDKDGIPQEIPSHMLNAAISAKRNRMGSEEVKSPKKPKGRAPAPPELKNETYETDSDGEMETSSISNIELKPNDITIHQSEEVENIQSRRTASTGDLTKVHKKRKTSTGTLERAQSLDITDTGIPPLGKKHNSETESEESLLAKVLADPRLSFPLDGLNTFQRSKLKKSSDWGNLEDAILDLSNEPVQIQDVIDQEEPDPPVLTSNTSIVLEKSTKNYSTGTNEFLNSERSISEWDPYYKCTYTNASDDVKVSRHSFTSLNDCNISNIIIDTTTETNGDSRTETNVDFYVTASDQTVINEEVPIEGPTSLTVQINDLSSISDESTKSPTYITEIRVPTPTNKTTLDDVEKELHKIQELAEEQLKELPEMRFSNSDNQRATSQVEQLRSNFEKSPSKGSLKLETKSRIPVATIKTPPTSPERRDSRNFDMEIDKDIVAIMSSPIHSTPKYPPKAASRNVSVTSIRSSSKIPSGLPSRPPIPPRKYDSNEPNSNGHSSFKQWVFNPNDSTITNITVSDGKFERK